MKHAHFQLPPLPLERTLTIAVLALATLFTLMKPISAIDLHIFLRMGAWMAEHGGVLEIEPFALAAEGVRFQNGTWLAQRLLFETFRLGGYPALQYLLAGATLATLVAATAHLVNRASWGLAAVGTMWVLAFLLQNLAIRPQTFALPLFAVVYLLLDRCPDRRGVPFALAGLLAFWSNLHGSFPVIFALPAAYWLEDLLARRRGDPTRADRPSRWIVLAAFMLLGTLVNPYGPGVYGYILENSAMPVQRGLSEWLAPAPASFLGVRFYLSLAITAGLAWWARRRLTLSDVLLIGAFGLLAARSQRMIVWWGLISAPVLARWIATRAPRKETTGEPSTLHTRIGWASLAFWVLLGIAAIPARTEAIDARGDYANLDRDTPSEAATFLSTRPGGRLFHRLEWGSYLAWRLWPAWRTFIDIRVWIFEDTVWQAYLEAGRAEPGWEALMDRYDIDTLLLSRETQGPLIDAVSSSSRWRRVHEDGLAVVFTRAAAPAGAATAIEPSPP